MKKVLIALSALLILFLVFDFFVVSKYGTTKYGKDAHKRVDSFEKSNFNKEYYKTNDLLLINVWATWCEPCIEEFPKLEKFDSIKKLKFLNISDDKDALKLKKFLNKNPKIRDRDLTFKNFYSRDSIFKIIELPGFGESFGPIKVGATILPYTVLIKNKKILCKANDDIDIEKLQKLIDQNK